MGIGNFYISFCVREIKKGEEITTNYYDASLTYKDRQERLLKSWGFKCNCQLCKYQEKKNDSEYNDFIKLFISGDKSSISLKIAKEFESYLEKNKKKFNCYELANGYLQLETYNSLREDLINTNKFSDLVTKYAEGKNYLFQITNLFQLVSYIKKVNNNFDEGSELLRVIEKIKNIFNKYTPFTEEDIQFFINDNIRQNIIDTNNNTQSPISIKLSI